MSIVILFAKQGRDIVGRMTHCASAIQPRNFAPIGRLALTVARNLTVVDWICRKALNNRAIRPIVTVAVLSESGERSAHGFERINFATQLDSACFRERLYVGAGPFRI